MKKITATRTIGTNSTEMYISICFNGMSFMLPNVERVLVSTYGDGTATGRFSVYMKEGFFEFSVDNDYQILMDAMIDEGVKVDVN